MLYFAVVRHFVRLARDAMSHQGSREGNSILVFHSCVWCVHRHDLPHARCSQLLDSIDTHKSNEVTIDHFSLGPA